MSDNRKTLKEEDLAKIVGGEPDNQGYSTVYENMCVCPGCGQSTASYYYKANPARCVKIECKCGYLQEDENGIGRTQW